MEYDFDEHPDSYLTKAAAIVFDKIDNEKAGFLPSSNLVEFIKTFGEGFHSEELAGQMRKFDLDERGSLDRGRGGLSGIRR